MPTFIKNLVVLLALSFSMLLHAEIKAKQTVQINGLVWTSQSVRLTYERADDYCRALKQDSGGWRLPLLEELQALYQNKKGFALLNVEKDDPSLWSSHYGYENMPEEVDLFDMEKGFVHHRHESRGYGEVLCVKKAHN